MIASLALSCAEAEKGDVDTSLRDSLDWRSVPNTWSSKGAVRGSRNEGLPSDLERADADTRSGVSLPERVREEQRRQGEGWLWEDGGVVGEGCCLDQETCGGEQSLVLWRLVSGAGARRDVDLSVCGALRVRDQGARSAAYLKTCFDVSNGSDCVDLGLGEDEIQGFGRLRCRHVSCQCQFSIRVTPGC